MSMSDDELSRIEFLTRQEDHLTRQAETTLRLVAEVRRLSRVLTWIEHHVPSTVHLRHDDQPNWCADGLRLVVRAKCAVAAEMHP